MFLANIQLENFRGIEELSLNFVCADESKKLRQWTVILGENGTGKSNILKAIALVTAGRDALGELLETPSDWISVGKDSCTITAIIHSEKGKSSEISLQIQRGDSLKKILKNNAASLKILDKKLTKNESKYFLVGYGAYRKVAEDKVTTNLSDLYKNARAKRAASLFNRSISYHSMEAWAMDLSKKELKTIGQSINKCLPDIQLHSIDKTTKKLLFETPSGIVPLELLSNGYQNMVGWFGDLLFHIMQVFGKVESPFSAKGILLVDELSVHLHPIWQRMLVSYLEELLPNFQIISTTNAPLTAQQVPENCLYYLQREDGKIELQAFHGNPQMVRLEQLIRMPAFGLSTVKSVMVEKKTKAYQAAKSAGGYESNAGLKTRSLDTPTSETDELTGFLKEVPNLDYVTKDDQSQLDLLAKIEKHLKSNPK